MTASAPRSSPPSLGNILSIALPLALLIGLVAGWMYLSATASHRQVPYRTLIRYSMLAPTQLDAEYTDADGDLVADPPSDPAKRINPETLLFATLDRDQERDVWREFADHLAKATGKKIEQVARPDGIGGATSSLREGTIHVLALTTGQVPTAVNRAGFVPCCVMADADGKFGYQMEILVAADSPIQNPKELRGKLVALGSMGSNSSYKAPTVTLWKEFGLVVDNDYRVVQSIEPSLAVEGVCKGRYDAAPVANDLLRRIVAESKDKAAKSDDSSAGLEGKYRSIYKSRTYPPACFGHAHNLDPELARKVRDAFLSFDWKGTKLEDAYRASNQSRFVAISYQKDWEIVRETDELMNEFLQSGP